MIKLALAMIVKGSDDEAEVLDRCLSYVSTNVDGIFVTRTQKSGEKKNAKVAEVVEKYGGVLSDWEWNYSFADARNFNFSQVPTEYDFIFWLDADDVVRGMGDLKETIDTHKINDAFSLMYLYAFDEQKNPIVVHQKTRIVKNDGCVSWAGDLHEDFRENRSLRRQFIDGIDVLHLTDEKRIEQNKNRNVEVAQKQKERKPNDPRSYWNLGNALKGAGNNADALEEFKEFLELSSSDEEKYIVLLRMAEIYLALKEKSYALDCTRMAIGIRPEYPDAYMLSGYVLEAMGKLERARDQLLMGLTKKPPYYSIIVYNPRDYDAIPLKALARIYFGLSMPTLALECLKGVAKIYPKDKGIKHGIKALEKESKKFHVVMEVVQKVRKLKKKESIRKYLESLDDAVRQHPAICKIWNEHFPKLESSGKDIAYYCGYTAEEWTPETAKKRGIGGSEEAVIHLSKRWAAMGYNVTVYNNCGHKEQIFDGVTYAPFWKFNPKDKMDTLILWRSPMLCDYDLNADRILIDLHDVIQEAEFTPSRLNRIHKIFVKSQFHRSLFTKVPVAKIVVLPNGIDASVFAEVPEKDPYLLINTSSPDRSLSLLVDSFAEIKSRVPRAKLQWAYGWGVFDVVHGDDKRAMEWKENLVKKMKEVGIEELGRLSHGAVAQLYQRGSIFAYPTEFAEIHCISAVKAQAAGCYPITTDFAALNETVQHGIKIHSEKTKDTWCQDYQFDFSLENTEARKAWVEAVVRTLQHPPTQEEMTRMREWATATYNWDYIASSWMTELK